MYFWGIVSLKKQIGMKNTLLLLLLIFSIQSCSKEKENILRSVRITTVQLGTYPVKNNGIDWDAFSSFPDPYFIFTKANVPQSDFQSPVWDEAQQNQAFWSTNIVCFADQSGTFVFFDEDGANDDFMDSVFLDMDELKRNGYPAQMIFTGANGSKVILTMEYTFE